MWAYRKVIGRCFATVFTKWDSTPAQARKPGQQTAHVRTRMSLGTQKLTTSRVSRLKRSDQVVCLHRLPASRLNNAQPFPTHPGALFPYATSRSTQWVGRKACVEHTSQLRGTKWVTEQNRFIRRETLRYFYFIFLVPFHLSPTFSSNLISFCTAVFVYALWVAVQILAFVRCACKAPWTFFLSAQQVSSPLLYCYDYYL